MTKGSPSESTTIRSLLDLVAGEDFARRLPDQIADTIMVTESLRPRWRRARGASSPAA
jgi:hypothetical protein